MNSFLLADNTNTMKLPHHILIQIAYHLTPRDLVNYLPLIKINDDHIFWSTKIQQDFPNLKDAKVDNLKTMYFRYYKIKNKLAVYSKWKPIPEPFVRTQYNQKWKNPSGLRMNDMTGWTLSTDATNPLIAYMYPTSYYRISPLQRPQEGENHPLIMGRINFLTGSCDIIDWDAVYRFS